VDLIVLVQRGGAPGSVAVSWRGPVLRVRCHGSQADLSRI